MRVLVAGGGTGGHLMPALALADELVRRDLGIEPVLVGARRGLEARLLPERTPRYRFHLLPVRPIYRRQWWRNAAWLTTAPRLWRACGAILDAERPHAVISTGGYAAGPIAYRAARRGIPLVLQEQNALPGITTRWLTPHARQIHLGFPEARERLRETNAAIFSLGNPSPVVAGDRGAARRTLGLPADARVLFVMCGSQGARAVNQVVGAALERDTLGGVHVLWACGPLHADYAMRFHAPPRVIVRPFWDPVAVAFQAADLAVTRAGAMTSAELAAVGLPSIMIPLPSAAEGHQLVNARALELAGSTVCLLEEEASVHSLSTKIVELISDSGRLEAMSRAANTRANPTATSDIVDQVVTVLD